MHILDNVSDKSLKNVILYFTYQEAEKFYNQLQESCYEPLNNPHQISPNGLEKKITVCIYDPNRLGELDERSVNLIVNDV